MEEAKVENYAKERDYFGLQTRGQGEMDWSILLWLSVKHGMAYVVNNPNAQDM